MSDVLQLDLQQISNKLKPLAEVQISKESMVSDNYDLNTKNFLTFIIDAIETAKTNESVSTDQVIYKVNDLVKSANGLLSNYFENNSLSAYYSEVLSSTLDSISESLNTVGETFNVDNVKTIIVDVLKTLNENGEKERQKQFEESLTLFKEEFSQSFTTEISNKSNDLQKSVEQNVQKEIDNNKTNLQKEINKSTKLLLEKTVPDYMKSLNKVFNKNFKQYIEYNFTNKNKQLKIANRLRNVFNGVLMPFVFASKCVKSAKDGLLSIGHKVKTSLVEKILKPVSAWKAKIKSRVNEKIQNMRKRFLKATRFIRRPKRMMKLWFGKIRKKLDSSDSLNVLKKYGLLGLLIKSVYNMFRKISKKYRLLGEMNFKPFQMLSVAKNTVDEFIESVHSHSTIILSNLKIYFEDNIVEDQNSRKKLGFFGKIKAKLKKKDKEKGFNIWDFLTSLPGLFRIFKKIWKILKKLGKFLWRGMKFLYRLSKGLIKSFVRFLGRTLERIGVKMGWRGVANVGRQMKNWRSGANLAKNARSGKLWAKIRNIKDLPKTLKNLKSVQKAKDLVRLMKPKNLVTAIKNGKFLASGGVKGATQVAGKEAAKVGGKMAAKTGGKVAAKAGVALLAFAVDGFFAYQDAQDTDAMAKLYGIKASEVGAQQRTAYTIAGTLAGGSSLLDADWSSAASVGMAALDTAMTVSKYAAIGSIIPGVGTAVGAAIGLAVALIGTQRLAKAINWICDAAKAVWKGIKWLAALPGKLIEAYGKAVRWVATKLWEGTKAIGKAAWKGIKAIGRGIKWLADKYIAGVRKVGKAILNIGKKAWKGLKNLWGKAMALKNKISGAIQSVGKKLKKIFFSIKNKVAAKAKALVNNVKLKLKKIGSKLKDSISSIGKSLLSTIFPFSPLVKAFGKAICKFFKGIKNFLFGEDDIQKQFKELQSKFDNVKTVASNAYTSYLKKKFENLVVLDSTPSDATDLDPMVKSDILDIAMLANMINDLFKEASQIVPVPVDSGKKEDEDTPATQAAEHWENEAEPATS